MIKKILSIVVVIFLVVLIYEYIEKEKNNDNCLATEVFTLYLEEGIVEYKTSENDEYQILKNESIELMTGTYVKTQEGYAHVIFEDNSMMSIDHNTEIMIAVNDESIDINQKSGSTWHRIQKVVKGKTYNVETSDTIATVRGTKFAVSFDNEDNIPQIFVIESEVEIKDFVVENGKKKILETYICKEGELFQRVNKKIKINKIPEDLKEKLWYKRNKILDKECEIGNIKEKVRVFKENEELKKINVEKDIGEIENFKEFEIEINSELKNYMVWEGDGSEFCKELRRTTVDEILQNFTSIEGEYEVEKGMEDKFKPIVEYMYKACNDGVIDERETNILRDFKLITSDE